MGTDFNSKSFRTITRNRRESYIYGGFVPFSAYLFHLFRFLSDALNQKAESLEKPRDSASIFLKISLTWGLFGDGAKITGFGWRQTADYSALSGAS